MRWDRIGSPDQSQENGFSSTLYVKDSIEFLAKPRFKDKAFLHQKYVVEKLSSQQIADLCFSSRPTISKYLRLHKIPLRDSNDRLAINKGQLAFGERSSNGAICQNQSELRVVKLICDLRKKGYSLRQIAAWLDARGIKTKNRSGPWTAASILKIHRRALGRAENGSDL